MTVTRRPPLVPGAAVARHDLPGSHFEGAEELFAGLSQRFPVGGLISHQFFRPSALTIDPLGMHLYVAAAP